MKWSSRTVIVELLWKSLIKKTLMSADRKVPRLKGENKAAVTDLNLSETLRRKHSGLPNGKISFPRLRQGLTGMAAVQRRGNVFLSGSSFPRVALQTTRISRCNLQSESCCNYTPGSSSSPSVKHANQERKVWEGGGVRLSALLKVFLHGLKK